jgi:outer membrane receptor for ferrienterochelin and colicin
MQINRYLTASMNYTYLDQSEKDDIVRQLLVMTPSHILNAQLRAMLPNGFSAGISYQFKDETEWRTYIWRNPATGDTTAGGIADSYGIVNVRLGYNFRIGAMGGEVAVAAFNLFDQQFNDYPLDTSNIGRRVTGFFSFKF